MIRRLAVAFREVDLAPVLAMMLITYGLSRLKELAVERQTELAELDGLLAERRGALAELRSTMAAMEYPTTDDVDPLRRAEEPEPAAT